MAMPPARAPLRKKDNVAESGAQAPSMRGSVQEESPPPKPAEKEKASPARKRERASDEIARPSIAPSRRKEAVAMRKPSLSELRAAVSRLELPASQQELMDCVVEELASSLTPGTQGTQRDLAQALKQRFDELAGTPMSA